MAVVLNVVQPVFLALQLGCRGKAPLSLSSRLGPLQLSGAMKLFLVSVFRTEKICVLSRQRRSRIYFPFIMVTTNV